MLDAGNLEWGEAVAGREASCLNQWARAFIGWGKGQHAETAQSALMVILKLVIGGLTSMILIVLGPVHLQSQGPFVSISWGQFSELQQFVSWL